MAREFDNVFSQQVMLREARPGSTPDQLAGTAADYLFDNQQVIVRLTFPGKDATVDLRMPEEKDRKAPTKPDGSPLFRNGVSAYTREDLKEQLRGVIQGALDEAAVRARDAEEEAKFGKGSAVVALLQKQREPREAGEVRKTV
jgi:hypothetical protein